MGKNPTARSGSALKAVGGRLKKVDQQIWVVVTLTVLIFAGMSAAIPHYASLYNIKTMINNYALEGIMALGMTLVIISGGIDLSVAGVMPFCAILFAFMMKGGLTYPVAMVLVLLIAAVIADCHIYDRHVPLVEKLLEREPLEAPEFYVNQEIKDFYDFKVDDFKFENYRWHEFTYRIPVAI